MSSAESRRKRIEPINAEREELFGKALDLLAPKTAADVKDDLATIKGAFYGRDR